MNNIFILLIGCEPHFLVELRKKKWEKKERELKLFDAGDVSVLSGQISQSKGLVSTDRSEVAALLSTTPRPRPRSSTNDLAPLHLMG